MNIKKHIPNLLTLGNLTCGVMGIYIICQSAHGHWHIELVFGLMLIAAIFDFLDGMVARLLRVSSDIGKQLDSLADMVTFGVLPGMIIINMAIQTTYHLHFLGLLLPVFSALRLAKFNIDEEQSHHFKGLPTPANAIFIAAFYVADLHTFGIFREEWLFSVLVITMSLLLVSNVPLLALKFKSLAWKENQAKFVLVICSIILLIVFKFVAIPLILPLYIIISWLHFKFNLL